VPTLIRTGSLLRQPLATGDIVAGVLLLLIVLYGGLLRFDALTLTHGVVDSPAWLKSLQETRLAGGAFRPGSFTWEPRQGRYISDPYTYLQYAREMRSFYAAHRREPLFPFATRISLLLLDDQDVAVSVASSAFSVLAILGTFLLGSYAFSRWVGLGAAAGLAIEYDVVTWGVGGWRDDAFTCAVVFSTYAMIRFARVPSSGHAVLLGTIAGLACLVRITSLSFLVPGFVYVAVTGREPWRLRTRQLAIGALVGALVAGPYVINCWRVFGDPLYAINVHADVYRETEGAIVEERQTASEYLRGHVRSRPMQTLETAVLGMTSYPFENKWRGFDQWAAPLGPGLSMAALAGLVLLLGSAPGRLLLVVLATSLVPYALTWRLIADWRFTQHAYPFFLIAAAYAIVWAAMIPARMRRLDRRDLSWRPVLRWSAVLVFLAVAVWGVHRRLPVMVAHETLLAGEEVNVGGGGRDAVFFEEGWSAPVTEGNVTARISGVPHPAIRLPLPAVDDYTLTLRLDPFPPPEGEDPAPLPVVQVFVNGQRVARLDTRWDPERVGSYDVRVPASIVRPRHNRLVLEATAFGQPAAVRLWYVRVRPPHGPGPGSDLDS
jgi:4-amino-4-deoxy-L-arabinose transferase-like glycosyltransferase